MSLMISGIVLPFEQPSQLAVEQAAQLLRGEKLLGVSVAKRSVDARHRDRISFVYTVAAEVDGDEEEIARRLRDPKITVKKDAPLQTAHGTSSLEAPPVIVGFGPAGMFAGLLLAREGYRPVILERGRDVDTRVDDVRRFWTQGILDAESNVQFGEGGAGTFSDGKLTTRIGDARCGFVLREMVRHGAPEEILWHSKPHLGTDRLRQIVKSIRAEIVSLGGVIHFGERLRGIGFGTDGRVKTVRTEKGERSAQALLLAPGHSARDTFAMLLEAGVVLESKPFSVGVRIEHLQADIDAALYGAAAGHPLLPKGEYQLSHRQGSRAVYTFCMCPGGVVVPAASEDGMVVTNGMSAYARDERNANSALVVSVDESDFGQGPLSGIVFQRSLEQVAFRAGGGGFAAPTQTVGRFLEGKGGLAQGKISPSYALGVADADFAQLFPQPIVNMLKTGLQGFKLQGFNEPDAVLTGIESRTSSPVRIPRDESMQATGSQGLYPCGEGAGYAGGIVSAAVDGIRAAQAVIARYKAI